MTTSGQASLDAERLAREEASCRNILEKTELGPLADVLSVLSFVQLGGLGLDDTARLAVDAPSDPKTGRWYFDSWDFDPFGFLRPDSPGGAPEHGVVQEPGRVATLQSPHEEGSLHSITQGVKGKADSSSTSRHRKRVDEC